MDQFLSMHRLFRSLQEKYRYVRKVSKLDLTRVEVHALLELDAEPSLGISDLASVLDVDPSVVSRSIQVLASKGLISIDEAEHDSRQKVLELTKAGREKILSIDHMAGETFDAFAAKLSLREEERLAYFFRTVADGLEQVPTTARNREKPFRQEHRRVTRALGFLKKDVFHSGMSSSVWTTLSEICQREVAPTAKDLAQLLSLAPNSMTAIIEKLERDGYITRVTDEENHRRRLLLSTEAGQKFLHELEVEAASELKRVLKALSHKEISEFINLLERIVGDWVFDADTLPGHLHIKRLDSLKDIKLARSFMLRELVHNGLEDFIPENFFSPELEVWALFDERGGRNAKKMCAACECLVSHHSWSVQVIVWSSELSRRTALSFMRGSYLASTKQSGPSELTIDFLPYRRDAKGSPSMQRASGV